MFSMNAARVTLIAALCVAGCSGFLSAPPLGAQSRLDRGQKIGLRQSRCISSCDSSVSRRAFLPLVLSPLLVQPAFASDTESFKDEVGASDGKAVDVSFSYPKSWKLEQKPGTIVVTDEKLDACRDDPDKCDFGQIFVRSVANGDNALVIVKTTDQEVSKLTNEFFKKAIFTRGGKFGAYGEPEVVKVMDDKTEGGVRTLSVKWNSFTPGGSTLAKRSIIVARTTGPDVFMLVVTSTGTRFKTAEGGLREVAASFKAARSERQAKVVETGGLRKSMFLKDNVEREALEQQRKDEGLY